MKFAIRMLLVQTVMCGIFYGQRSMAEGLLFSPSLLFFTYHDRDGGGDLAKVDAQYMDVRLGYITAKNLYVGGLYAQMKRADGNTDRTRTSFGPGIGIVYKQFFLLGHYIFDSEYEISTGAKLEDGSGVQIDLGYWFNVTGPFFAGPQVVHRSIDYKKKNNVTVNDSGSKETLPYLSLAFIF